MNQRHAAEMERIRREANQRQQNDLLGGILKAITTVIGAVASAATGNGNLSRGN